MKIMELKKNKNCKVIKTNLGIVCFENDETQKTNNNEIKITKNRYKETMNSLKNFM